MAETPEEKLREDAVAMAEGEAPEASLRTKAELHPEWIGCLIGVLVVFVPMGYVMGANYMISSLMQTAFALLNDTAFYIMAIAVVCGALASLFTEFGVTAMLNKVLSPLMRPLFGLPGAATVGGIACFMSDNPTIATMMMDRNYARYFKKYESVGLVNFGTTFGIGMIVVATMLASSGMGGVDTFAATGIGSIAAILGGAISTRALLIFGARAWGKDEPYIPGDYVESKGSTKGKVRHIRKGNAAMRAMDALLEGGADGVQLGLTIIPGILIFCTLVMMLLKTAPVDAETGAVLAYSGAAYEGVGLLPWLMNQISFILQPLFGFQNMENVAVPLTALGSASASMAQVPVLLEAGTMSAHEVAVVTAMCFCWSGFVDTHVGIMDKLGTRPFVGWALLTHFIGGIAAGVIANLLMTVLGM